MLHIAKVMPQCACCMQRLRKRCSTTAGRARSSKSVKVIAKDKFKVEPPDEVTCSTDDVRPHATAVEVPNIAACESSNDALLPDTTTEYVGDVIDDSAEGVVTSHGGRQSVSNAVVKTESMDNHGTTAQQQFVPVNATNQPYGLYRHQYVNIHHAAPLYYRNDPAPGHMAGREQHFTDDIDDILSVMASIAGITQPHV